MDLQNAGTNPYGIEALGGYHVNIKGPKSSGSNYYIQAKIVEYYSCWWKGPFSDGGIFRNSSLHESLINKTLNIQENRIIVTDDAFPVTTQIMKPYKKRNLSIPERIFGYRLARCIVKTAFGI